MVLLQQQAVADGVPFDRANPQDLVSLGNVPIRCGRKPLRATAAFGELLATLADWLPRLPLSPSAQEVRTEGRGTTGARLTLFSRKVGFWAFDPEFLGGLKVEANFVRR